MIEVYKKHGGNRQLDEDEINALFEDMPMAGNEPNFKDAIQNLLNQASSSANANAPKSHPPEFVEEVLVQPALKALQEEQQDKENAFRYGTRIAQLRAGKYFNLY